MVEVTINGITEEYEKGTTYREIAEKHPECCKYDIILARRGGKLIELNKKVKDNCTIEFLDTSTNSGHKTYVRGVTLLMLKAVYSVADSDKLKNVFVKHMIGDSCYCEVEGIELTEEFIKKVEEVMHDIADRDLLFEKRSVDTSEAVRLFEKHKMYDKKKLFEYRRVSKVNIYSLDGFEDY